MPELQNIYSFLVIGVLLVLLAKVFSVRYKDDDDDDFDGGRPA